MLYLNGGFLLNNFFRNRYGFDRLSLMLAVFALFFIFSRYLWPLAVLLVALALFRAASKNVARRQMELRKFEIAAARLGGFLDRMFRPLVNWIQRRKSMRGQSKIYRYIKCRYCKKKLRVPKNKGKIKVTCPECKNQFIIKT